MPKYKSVEEERKKLEIDRKKPEQRLKYEIAEELGLMPKVLQDGWKSLSAKETGRIGGLITKKRKELKKLAEDSRAAVE